MNYFIFLGNVSKQNMRNILWIKLISCEDVLPYNAFYDDYWIQRGPDCQARCSKVRFWCPEHFCFCPQDRQHVQKMKDPRCSLKDSWRHRAHFVSKHSIHNMGACQKIHFYITEISVLTTADLNVQNVVYRVELFEDFWRLPKMAHKSMRLIVRSKWTSI